VVDHRRLDVVVGGPDRVDESSEVCVHTDWVAPGAR
jgi:hypothetical protein